MVQVAFLILLVKHRTSYQKITYPMFKYSSNQFNVLFVAIILSQFDINQNLSRWYWK